MIRPFNAVAGILTTFTALHVLAQAGPAHIQLGETVRGDSRSDDVMLQQTDVTKPSVERVATKLRKRHSASNRLFLASITAVVAAALLYILVSCVHAIRADLRGASPRRLLVRSNL